MDRSRVLYTGEVSSDMGAEANPACGLALNFAHRGAWWSLLGLLTVPLGVVLLFVLLHLLR